MLGLVLGLILGALLIEHIKASVWARLRDRQP